MSFEQHDKVLFQQVASGDSKAFQVLFNKYWSQVYGTSLRLTRSPEQSKDLSQDIFAKLWENRQRLANLDNPQAYIYILSRNLVMDHLRKKVFDPANIDFLVQYFRDANDSPQEKIELQELEKTLTDAIEHLPIKVREVFKLSRFEGLTHEQIAERLSISVVSSKTYIVRALQHIRQYMADNADDKLLVLALALLTRQYI